MSNYSTPILIYGFNMGDKEFIIDYYCLENKFPFVHLYTDYIQDGILYQAIYGIECEIDQDTAEIIICDEHKQEVKNLLDEYINYLKENYDKTDFLKKIKEISLCFLAYSDDEDDEDNEDNNDEDNDDNIVDRDDKDNDNISNKFF